MMNPAVSDLIDLFDDEGAFIFVERNGRERPVFHVQTSVNIKATGTHFPTGEDDSALIAPDLLLQMPAMLADTISRLANDLTVVIVYAYTEALANRLVSEASRLPNQPYVSRDGQMMDAILQNVRAGAANGR